MNNIPESERMALDFDGWLGSQEPAMKDQITGWIDSVPDGEKQLQKDRLASQFIVAESTGLPIAQVSQDWDMVRGGFAVQNGSEWFGGVNDDAQFSAKVKAEATFRRDERQIVFGPDDTKDVEGFKNSLAAKVQEAAFAGVPYPDALAAWQESATKSTGWREDRTGVHNDVGREIYERSAATVAKVKPIADEAFGKIAAYREVGGADSAPDMAPFALFRGLSADEKQMAFRMMTQKALSGDSKDSMDAFFERVGRGFENMAMGLDAGYRHALATKRFAAGEKATGSSAVESVRGKDSDVRRAMRTFGKGPIDTLLDSDPSQVLTAEKAAEWNAELDAARDDFETMESLRKFGMEVIDNTNNTNGGFVFKKMVLPVADSVAILAGLSNPGTAWATLYASAGSYSNDEYAKLRSAGMDSAEASKIANITGVAQAALDKAGFEFLRGIPRVNQVLKKFAIGGSAGARFAANASGTLIAESAIEMTQDHVIPALAADFVSENSAYDFEWSNVWRDLMAKTDGGSNVLADTMLGMVLLSAAGGGYQTFSDSRMTRQLSNSRSAMSLAGYTDVQMDAIQSQPESERASLLSEFAPAKAPVGKEREALIGRVVEEAQKERAAFVEKLKAETGEVSDAMDYAVRVTRSQGSGWTVTTESGKSLVVDTAEAARRIRQDLGQAASQREADTLVALVEDWHLADDKAQRETTFTGETATSDGASITYKRDGKITREITDAATLETLRKEAEVVAQQTGHGAVNVIVNGSNQTFQTKVADAVSQVVQRLEINRSASSVLTFLHESMESNWRAGMQSGAFDRAATQRAVAAIAGAFRVDGKNAQTRAFNQRVQRVADGTASDTELRETVSELAVADIIGRRKDGGSVKVGSISRAISDAIQRAASESDIAGLSKIQAFIRAAKTFFRGVLGAVAAIRKAKKKDGKLAEDWEAFMHKLTGTSEQAAHDAGRVSDLNAKLAEANAGSENYVPPTAEMEDAGIMFSVSDYAMSHRPNSEGPRGHNLLEGDLAPRDIYERPDYYTGQPGTKEFRETVTALRKMKGKPDSIVEIYRASPVAELNSGDWVSLSREYAKQHGMADDPSEDVPVHSHEVKASEIRWAGDDIAEFGYFPETSNQTFSISPSAHVELLQRQVDAQLKRDPDRSRKLGKLANDKLQSIQFNYETDRENKNGAKTRALVEQRTPESLNKEQAFREGDLFRKELEAIGLTGADAKRSKDSRDYEQWQREQESIDLLLKSGWSKEEAEKMGAKVAEKWRSNFIANTKAALSKAKESAWEWRREQDELQKEDWNPKAKTLRYLRELDAVLSVLPPELRAKVGGFVKIVELSTDAARQKEIGKRIEKMGKLVERHLHKESVEAIERLIEKAEPSAGPGEKPKGKITVEGHRVFAAVDAVRGMTTEQVDAERARLATAIEDRITKGEDVIDLLEQEQLLEMFGAIEEKTAAEADAATTWLDNVYRTGKNAWRMIEESRLAEVGKLVREFPKGTEAQIQERLANLAKSKAFFVNGGTLSLFSYVQVLEELFPHDARIVKLWNRGIQDATRQKNNAIAASNARMKDAAVAAGLGKTNLEVNRRFFTMQHEHNIDLPKTEYGEKGKSSISQPVTREQLAKFLDGTSDFVTLGYSQSELDDIEAQSLDPANSKKKQFTVTRKHAGADSVVKISEMKAIGLTLAYRQERYHKNFEHHGYSAASIAAAEAGISAEGKAFREFFAREYRDNFEPLAAVFRGMFGIDLPQEPDYSPMEFYSRGKDYARGPDDLVDSGGFRASMLISRKAHLAQPQLTDALTAFRGHTAQMEHWRAFAPIVRQMRGVIGDPRVAISIKASHGDLMLEAVQDWVGAFEQNGIKVAQTPIDRFAQKFTKKSALMILAYNLSTLLKNTIGPGTAVSSVIGIGNYLTGVKRLLSGKIDVKAMRDSYIIQERLQNAFTPEIRTAMAAFMEGEPSKWKDFMIYGLDVPGRTDAWWTGIGAAIAYDYHLQQGATPEQAMEEAADAVARTAQPVDMANRSLEELKMSGKVKTIFQFASNQRMETAGMIAAIKNVRSGKITKQKAFEILAVRWLWQGIVSTVAGSIVRDLRDDDDDEWLDDKYWNPLDMFLNVFYGPLGGIPLANMVQSLAAGITRKAIQTVGNKMGADIESKPIYGANTPVDGIEKGLKEIGSIGDGDKHESIEKTVHRADSILKAAAMIFDKAEPVAVGFGIARQLFDIGDSLLPDSEDEVEMKEKAAISKERSKERRKNKRESEE